MFTSDHIVNRVCTSE